MRKNKKGLFILLSMFTNQDCQINKGSKWPICNLTCPNFCTPLNPWKFHVYLKFNSINITNLQMTWAGSFWVWLIVFVTSFQRTCAGSFWGWLIVFVTNFQRTCADSFWVWLFVFIEQNESKQHLHSTFSKQDFSLSELERIFEYIRICKNLNIFEYSIQYILNFRILSNIRFGKFVTTNYSPYSIRSNFDIRYNTVLYTCTHCKPVHNNYLQYIFTVYTWTVY